jgi:arabinogalactan oligomer / maltooligosaccharide transport system substrate-binding protein
MTMFRRLTLTFLLIAMSTSLAQITVWTHFGDNDLTWLEAEASAFEAIFGVPVTITRIDLGEITQRMLLSAPQGEAADLIIPIPHDQLGEMAAGGVLADMGQYASDSELADLTEQARLAFTFGGSLFGLPMYVEGPALIYNTDLMPDLPDTFEAFLERAQSLEDGDTAGFMYDINNFYFSYVFINSLGGYVFAREDGSLNPADVGLASEGAVAGVSLMHDLRYEYELVPAGSNSEVAEGLFADGRLGAIFSGPWTIGNFRNAGVPLAVAPIPATADGTTFSGFMGVQGVLMNEFSENKTDAANFAKFLTRADAQVALARSSGRIPSSLTAANEVADDPVIAGFAVALADAEPMPNIPQMGRVWEPMANALELIMADPNAEIEATLEQAVTQITEN